MLKLAILCAVLTYVAASPLYGDGRIVNGTNAKPGEIPSIVSLRNYGSHSCGGSILDETHILTAAHCVSGGNPNNLQIQYGILNIRSNENLIKVAAIYAHENYNPSKNYANDIAVLKLASPIPLGNNVQKVVLPAQGEAPPGGEWAVVAGWGLQRSGGSVQDDLKRVDILVFTDAYCKEELGSSVNFAYHVCAGIYGGGKGECNGDSGGPLIANGKEVGVVSWSFKPCTSRGNPGVYSRVASYIDWINSKLVL